MTTRKAGPKGPPCTPSRVTKIRRPPVAWIHDPAATQEMLDLSARLRGLDNLARRIFIDRNATGMPPAYRAKTVATTRPHHRQAIAWLRAARDALLEGDEVRWELLATKACAKLEHVQVLFRQPVMAERARTMPKRNEGSRAKDPLRARIVAAMKRGRASHTAFKVFMDAWTKERALDGLTIRLATHGVHAGKYLIEDERNHKLVMKAYTWGSLEKLYSTAAGF